MKEFESGEKRNPESMQTDLRHIYASLPKISAIIPSHINYDTLSTIEKSGYFAQIAEWEERRMKSIVPRRQLALLATLLREIQITSVFKAAIQTSFEDYFRSGLRNGDSIVEILGITDEMPLKEGVFSEDPKDRMEIEIRFRDDLLDDLDYFVDNPDNLTDIDYRTEQIALREAKLDIFELQFLQIYEKPVEEVYK